MFDHRLAALFLAVSCAVLAAPGTAAAQQEGPWLARNGESAYTIVLRQDASPSERYAAEELQHFIKACTGAELPIAESDSGDGPCIVLGLGAAAEKRGVKPGPGDLGEQGYLMRTAGSDLVIAGTPAAGTLYGVYDFLHDVAGVRFFAPGVTRTPGHDALALPQIDRLKRPPFDWRHTSYAWPGADEAFLTRMRDNQGGGGPDNKFGVEHSHDGRCHSYHRYVSTGEFFDTHPEYFSEISGKRRRYETQLCLTNPEVLDIVTERILKRMEERPGDRQHNFSQEDYYNYCECEQCRAMNEQYGTDGGTQFWFVNQLAERTSKVYPDKLIGTLAYMYTEEPPKGMKMHPNVAVWLCHMFPSCDSHPIVSCPRDADYKRRAQAWSEICEHLYIWHYIVDFAHYYNPFPNFRAMVSDIRFYHDIGVEGVYLQAMGHGGGGGEFSLLRPYYGMRLLWDPDQNAEALMKDFLEGYYGAAWKPIYQYITMLHDKVEDENIHMHLYTNSAMGYLPDAVIAKAQTLFDEAEAAVAEDEELLERVKVCRMPLTYARLFPRNGYTIDDGILTFQGDIASMSDALAFYQRMEKHGFKTIREWGGEPQQLAMLASLLNTPMRLEVIENAHLRVEVAPLLGGRTLRIVDKASGESITASNVKESLYFPFAGGEETRLGGQFRPMGWFDPYGVTDKTRTSVEVAAPVDGFTLRRTLSLAPDAPVLRIKVSAENAGEKPREILMRHHMEFDLGPLRETEVWFTSRDGEKVIPSMDRIIAGLREGEYYKTGRAPDGEWTFSGPKGVEVVARFDPELLDFAWLYAYPEDLDELEAELWVKRTTVPAGGSLTSVHEIEVRPAQ